jgi:hypothetical protein
LRQIVRGGLRFFVDSEAERKAAFLRRIDKAAKLRRRPGTTLGASVRG